MRVVDRVTFIVTFSIKSNQHVSTEEHTEPLRDLKVLPGSPLRLD